LANTAAAQFAGFSGPLHIPLSSDPRGLVVADFDNDGDADVAVALSSVNQVAIILNNSDGTFGAPTEFPVGVGPVVLAAHDMDGDGDVDILVTNFTDNTVTYLQNNGFASFTAMATLPVGTQPWGVDVADFDNDGNQDFVVVNTFDDTVTIFYGNGAGLFSASAAISVSNPILLPTVANDPIRVVARDFNRDANIDILTGNQSSGNISLLYGTGSRLNPVDTTATSIIQTGEKPFGLAALDIDNDGFLDAVTTSRSNGTNNNNITFLHNNTVILSISSSFAISTIQNWDAAVADFDLDNRQDVLFTSYNGLATPPVHSLTLFRNTTGGWAQESFPDAMDSFPVSVAVADVDHDGDMDAVVANGGTNEVAVFFNATFSPPEAQITTPANGACVSTNLTITGVADLPSGGFSNYLVEVKPLMSSVWTLVQQSTTPVVGGLLAGFWDSSALPEGWLQIRLTAHNTTGLETQDMITVWLSHVFDMVDFFISDGKTPPAPAPVVGGTVCFYGTVTDEGCAPDTYTVKAAPIGSGVFTSVDPLTVDYAGDRVNEAIATWDTIGLGVVDGDYDLDVLGWNVWGQSAEQFQTVTIDNAPPQALITSPANFTEAQPGDVVTITGSVQDANLNNWVVQYSEPVSGLWVTIASSATNVLNGVLATWDTTGLPRGLYPLRLVALDNSIVNCSEQTHRTEQLITIALRCPGDITGDGNTGPGDLLFLLSSWGLVCP